MGGGGIDSGGGHADFPKTRAQVIHIFAAREGHLPDTPENRKLIYDTANDFVNFVGQDARRMKWYAKKQKDGSQLWVKVYKDTIADAGLNETPASWDDERGLVRPGKTIAGKPGKTRRKK